MPLSFTSFAASTRPVSRHDRAISQADALDAGGFQLGLGDDFPLIPNMKFNGFSMNRRPFHRRQRAGRCEHTSAPADSKAAAFDDVVEFGLPAKIPRARVT